MKSTWNLILSENTFSAKNKFSEIIYIPSMAIPKTTIINASVLVCILLVTSCEINHDPTGPNLNPTLSILQPDRDLVIGHDTVLSIILQPIDADGEIKKVELFRNGTIIKTFTSPPYQYDSFQVEVKNEGVFTLLAIAYDDQGATGQEERRIEVKEFKHFKRTVLHTLEYQNGVEKSFVDEYVYQYNQYNENQLSAIWHDGIKSVEFSFENDLLTAMKYYASNVEILISTDSFYYSPAKRLVKIRSRNSATWLLSDKLFNFQNDTLKGLTVNYYYPNPYSQEFHYNYSGGNIDTIPDVIYPYSYSYNYTSEPRSMDIDFFLQILGFYQFYPGGIYGFTLPYMFSANRIESIDSYDVLNVLTFRDTFEYFYSGEDLIGFNVKRHDKNGEQVHSLEFSFYYQ